MEAIEKCTEKEQAVLKVIADTMQMYGEEGFSDVMVEDVVAETGFSVGTVKGLLGSLIKKGLVFPFDVNGEYNVYYLQYGEAREHFGLTCAE